MSCFPNTSRGIALAIAALLFSASAHATLVAVVPARDGLAIAADSRYTFMGAPCDGAFKIIEAERPLHTVAFVTGDSIFVAPAPAGENPCRYLATAPRLLDMGAVVKAYLNRASDNPARLSMPGLAAECVRAVDAFRHRYPKALQGYSGKDLFSVVVASYDPSRHVSTLWNFVVRIDALNRSIEAARLNQTTITPPTPRGVWIYGETGYVNREVYAGPARRFLNPATQDFLHASQSVGEVGLDAAVAAAADVVQAASRAAAIDPPANGIGGTVRVVVLSSRPQPQLLPHSR